MKSDPTILVASGLTWAGFGVRSIDSSTREIIQRATSELHLLVYSASLAGIPILDLLEPRIQVGIRLTMVVNRASEAHERMVVERLHKLASKFSHAHIFSFEPKSTLRNLHAKAIIADREVGIIGSANLSRRGLLENYELGVQVSGKIARDTSVLVDRLAGNPESVPIGALDE